ncbi:MAG: hypothetical protein U1E11_01510 [Dethiobacteria bacterium]|nr:hypothetical protein [Dethiobacteria bacterium]
MDNLIPLIVFIVIFNLIRNIIKSVQAGKTTTARRPAVASPVQQPKLPAEQGIEQLMAKLGIAPPAVEQKSDQRYEEDLDYDEMDEYEADEYEAEAEVEVLAPLAAVRSQPMKQSTAKPCRPSSVATGLQQVLTKRDSLVSAYIFHEIFGPPVTGRRRR